MVINNMYSKFSGENRHQQNLIKDFQGHLLSLLYLWAATNIDKHIFFGYPKVYEPDRLSPTACHSSQSSDRLSSG